MRHETERRLTHSSSNKNIFTTNTQSGFSLQLSMVLRYAHRINIRSIGVTKISQLNVKSIILNNNETVRMLEIGLSMEHPGTAINGSIHFKDLFRCIQDSISLLYLCSDTKYTRHSFLGFFSCGKLVYRNT